MKIADLRQTVQLRPYFLKHVIINPEQSNVFGEIIEVFAVRPEAASSKRYDGSGFGAATSANCGLNLSITKARASTEPCGVITGRNAGV